MNRSTPSNDPPAPPTRLSLDDAIKHFLADLPVETARRIRLASGIDSPALRTVYRESRQVPALLLDTRQRFELEQEIEDFLDTLSRPASAEPAVTTLSWQLHLFGLDLLWPKTSVLQIYDVPGGEAAAEYGPDLSPRLPRVRIERAKVLDGSLWSSVLQHLSPTERDSLLGGEYSSPDAQLSALRRKAAVVLSKHREDLFDRLYAFRQQSRDPLVTLLRNRVPQLSQSAAHELLANSSAHDLQSLTLSEGEPSKAQTRDAHWYLLEERLSQAHEGLFLESRQRNEDTCRLMLHLLASLPGWPGAVRLELRERTPDGALLASAGAPGATQAHLILRRDGGFILHTDPEPAEGLQHDLPAALATLPDSLRTPLGLTDRQAIQHLLRQQAPLSRAHLRALLGIAPLEPAQRLSDSNGYLQDSPGSFVGPDQLAQRQRETFDALAATNERTLSLTRQQPNFRWFAALLLSRQLARDFPQAASTDPDAICLNVYEQSLYWPLSDSGERGEQVRYRGVTQSRTLTEVFTEHLAGNTQTFDTASSGLYASATAAYDTEQLSGLDLGRLEKTLEAAGLGFDTRLLEAVDSFWSSAAPLLQENLRTQIRLEAQLRELDLSLDESNRQDLERVLEYPRHDLRRKHYPIGGPIYVYRIALKPSDLMLAGCLVITRSPIEDTYKIPALLYQVGRGLEQLPTLQALTSSLTLRLADKAERESLLDLLPQGQRTWSPPKATDDSAPFSYVLEQDAPFKRLVDDLRTKQKEDFTDAWRFAKGAPGLDNDVGEFAKQLDSAASLTRLLDIVPALQRRNRDLMFSDLLTRLNGISLDEQTQLATLWRPTLEATPVPSSLSSLPALKAHAADLLKTHLQQHYPLIQVAPDDILVQVSQTTYHLSPAWQSQPPPTRVHPRSLSLTALALENIKGVRLAETTRFKAEIHNPSGTTVSLSNAQVNAIVRAVDAPGDYKRRLEQKLLGKDQAALRSTWLEVQRARMKLQAYIARLSGDFLDARDSTLERGYRRIEHLLKHPSARSRPLLDGYKVEANYLMLGGTGRARNGVSIDEVVLITSDDPTGRLLLYAPQAHDGKDWRELADTAALEALLREQDWKHYCIARAARNEQWDPAQLFARQFPLVRYFPIDGELFTTLYEARARHLISSVEYLGASNQRVDSEALWYWINVSWRFAAELLLGIAALPLSLPVYLLRGLYGLGNVGQALALGHHQEAVDALIQTLTDAAAPLPLQAFKPLLRQIRPLPGSRISRLIKTRRPSQDSLRQPLLSAEPSPATSLRSLAAELKDYEIGTVPELNYYRDGLFVDRTARMNHYVKLEGKWFRTGSRGGKRYLLKEHTWTEDIELVQIGKQWQPLPKGRLLGGAPEPVGLARYEIEAVHRGELDRLIRSVNTLLDPGWHVPSASALERQAAANVHQVSRRLVKEAQDFFDLRPAAPARSLAPDLLDAGLSTHLLERSYRTGNGVVLGAPYHAKAGRQFLLDNMRSLAMEHQVKTLYMENLLRDFDQVHLNDFHNTGVMPERLRNTLRMEDIAHQIDPHGPHSLDELVSLAQRHGIRVQGLDCAASFRQGLRNYSPNRARALKYYARQVINTDQMQQGPHRWIALVQDSHASPVHGELGLADLLGAVNLRAVDVGGQLLPLRVLTDAGEHTQGVFAMDIQLVQADAKLEVNVSPQPLAIRPAAHRSLLIRQKDFLLEQNGEQYTIVCRPASPDGRQLLPVELPVIRSRLADNAGSPYETFHIEAPLIGDIRGVRYKSIDDLLWGLRQLDMRQVVELNNVSYLRQPRLDTHPQLRRAGMFTVETTPQGSVLVNRSRDRTLTPTIIRTDRATGKFYIVHQRWGFSQAQLFDSIDDLTQELVQKVGLVRVIESTDL